MDTCPGTWDGFFSSLAFIVGGFVLALLMFPFLLHFAVHEMRMIGHVLYLSYRGNLACSFLFDGY